MTGTHPLLVLSNRGPVSFSQAADGTVVTKRAAGGLVVALGPGVERDGALWVSAEVGDESGPASTGAVEAEGLAVQTLTLDSDDYRAYYDVIANQTVWFALHGLWDMPRRPRFDRHWWAAWERFGAVNEKFAETTAASAAPGATVLVQDFHLALVPSLLAARRPDLHIATFLHTPWCSPEQWSVLPERVATDLLAGLADGGAAGFHSARWAEAFTACCQRWLGRTPTTFISPAATDSDDLAAVAESDACEAELRQLDDLVAGRQLIVRVDRIELSKNVLRGFWAYDELLEIRPDLRGQVVFAAMVYPSRLGLAEYLAYGQEVTALVERLNAKWEAAVPGWKAIMLDPADNHPRSVAALRRSDVLLVNPVRDGLNLVAKEGPLVNERDGVLVLSQQAGAWDELGAHAIGINPYDISGTAAAIGEALDMPAEERAGRAEALRKTVAGRGPLDWFDEQVAAASGQA
jgi:trehalose 6-phosphate synthase